MSSDELIRMWKDPDSRDISEMDHPAGEIELYQAGGASVASSEYVFTFGCCGGFTASTCGCTWGNQCLNTIPEICNPPSGPCYMYGA